jgi:Spherulation-specific family 4
MTPLKNNVVCLFVSLCTGLGLALGLMAGTALAAITSYSAANDETSVFYRLQYTGTYRFYRVYIDTDQNTATGFQTGGLGAEYLVENGNLFRYTGTGTTWSWSFVQSVRYSNAAGVAQWTVARADIGETETPNAASLLFQVEAPLESSSPYAHTYSGGASSVRQQLAIPSYFYPGPLWMQLQGGAPTVGLAIINPASGPGTSLDPPYATTTQTTQKQGTRVVGYVYTAYGTRAARAVMADIDTYYAWYGVDGIFLDETSNNCAQQGYYLTLYNYIKGKGGNNQWC